MIIRYFSALSANKYTNFTSNTETSFTARSVTYTTTVQGPKGAVVRFKLTTFTHSNPGAQYQCNGLTYVLNDFFDITLDSLGQTTLTQFLDVGTSSSGNGAAAIITITSVDIGLIGASDTAGLSKTT